MPSHYSASSPRAKAFCNEYLVDLNGTKAAERAGYSVRRARQVAADLLVLPEIRASIDQLMAVRAEQTRIKAFRVLEELAVICGLPLS